jgi:hypothetical protein
MKKFAFLIPFLFIATAQAQQMPCAKLNVLELKFKEKYGEVLVLTGVVGEATTAQMRFYASADKKTWTVGISQGDDICVMLSGTSIKTPDGFSQGESN